jgi:preprotein translocase subunit SecA
MSAKIPKRLLGQKARVERRELEEAAREIVERSSKWAELPSPRLETEAATLRERAILGASPDELLADVFAVGVELSVRCLGLRPHFEQVVAAIGLHRGVVVEMPTGEGKTLAAVFPAVLHALEGGGLHILTFNDYLARRDATWMDLLYRAFGLRVAAVQATMDAPARRAAYRADVTYATAKQVGYDFLRDGLAYQSSETVLRPFNFAIVDEADSILIDEARVPLVLAGTQADLSDRCAEVDAIVRRLNEGTDWKRESDGRNAQLTLEGIARVETALASGNLHLPENQEILSAVNVALHAHALLRRDVDYLVQDGRIRLVDELTGRVVEDRRWPGRLQAALETKEGVPVQPGALILNTITLQGLVRRFPRIAGMTATAAPAKDEFRDAYDLEVLVIPPHRPCIRVDLDDALHEDGSAKVAAIVDQVALLHVRGQPVLIGTGSVEESEALAEKLRQADLPVSVLNAKNDELESELIAAAGQEGAITISTNMAGRGTDIRLGGRDEASRLRVVAAGGLFVIGTSRQESRRTDEQLRGRAGRQGDPGSSRFYVSFDDPLLKRVGLDQELRMATTRGKRKPGRELRSVRATIAHAQRRLEGEHGDIRSMLYRYAGVIELQRHLIFEWRQSVREGEADREFFANLQPAKCADLEKRVGPVRRREIERVLHLQAIDRCWASHLAVLSEIREGIHLISIGGLDPFAEYYRQATKAFAGLAEEIEQSAATVFAELERDEAENWDASKRRPAATWTYMVNDRVVSGLARMLQGSGNFGVAAGAIATTPLLLFWGARQFLVQKLQPKSET